MTLGPAPPPQRRLHPQQVPRGLPPVEEDGSSVSWVQCCLTSSPVSGIGWRESLALKWSWSANPRPSVPWEMGQNQQDLGTLEPKASQVGPLWADPSNHWRGL